MSPQEKLSPRQTPAIVAPVMRCLPVAQPSRSAAFYHSTLGFEIREQPGAVEAVSGPARIRFETGDQEGETGRRIVFFETDDVDAMHAAIGARGGQPSHIEKVNWIKMRMFEVRDPDGHTLWFGQSFDVPHAPGPRPMLGKALPEMPLDNVAAGVTYYRDVLGFHINYQQHDLGVMDRDQVTVVLIARTEQHKGIGSAYFYVENADKLHAELLARGARLQGEPVSRPWGLREFQLTDAEGNILRFGQPFE